MAPDILRAIELCEDVLREYLAELDTHLVWTGRQRTFSRVTLDSHRMS